MPRVPRGTLNRDVIVDAALQAIDAQGVESLSMPKLAKRLGVGVMSLYTHVTNKDDLLDAVVQRVLSSLPSPVGDDWRERTLSHFRALRRALLAHPGLGHVLASKNVAGGVVLDLLESSLTELTAGGVGDDEAVRLYWAMLTYTLGFVAWELPRAHALGPGEYDRRWRQAVASCSLDTHPTLHRLIDQLSAVASEEQFDDGLQRLVDSAHG